VTGDAFPNLVASEAPAGLAGEAAFDFERDAAAAYRSLMGVSPQETKIDSDESFDRHVFASILALALTEGGPFADQAGLSGVELRALLSRCFSDSEFCASDRAEGATAPDDEEIEMVRDLLLANRSSPGELGRWLAAMVARRAVEPNHLWEDLGLRDRSELTRLIDRHFQPLAIRNDKNMRWKRFFYRMMCENDGFVMCSTPICSNCSDYNHCFGEEAGTSRLASVPRPSGDLTGS
jgi:nitrogen fixation protein NifQ